MYVFCQWRREMCHFPLRVWLSKPPSKKELRIVFNNCKIYEGSQIRSIRKFHQLQNKTPKSQTPADWVMLTVSWGKDKTRTSKPQNEWNASMEVLSGEKPKTSQSHGPDVGRSTMKIWDGWWGWTFRWYFTKIDRLWVVLVKSEGTLNILNGVNCMSIIVYYLLSVRISSEVCFSLKGCESFVKLFDAEQALKRQRERERKKNK